MNKYIIINIGLLTQPMLDASTTHSIDTLKISAPNANNQRFVLLRYVESIPLDVLKSGVTVLSSEQAAYILETEAIWLADSTPAVMNKALFFDGVTDTINFGDTFQYDHGVARSFALWIWIDNLAAPRMLWSKVTNDANVYGYRCYISAAGKLFYQMRASGYLRQHEFGIVLTTQSWHQVVVTYAGGSNLNGMKCYIDGVLDTIPSSQTMVTSILNGDNFHIGHGHGSWKFSGKMKNFSTWNRVMTQQEVTELYNNGSGFDVSIHASANNLLAKLNLGVGDAIPVVTDSVGASHGTTTGMTQDNVVDE